MSEHAALLRAILEDPACDVRRLAFADFLDERGSRADRDRAEFIRTQIAIARRRDMKCLRTAVDTLWHSFTSFCRREVCKLRRREYETSKRYCYTAWKPEGFYPTYSRGFVSEVLAHSTVALSPYYSPFRESPVTRVRLTDVVPAGPLEHGPRAGSWFYTRRDMGEILWSACFPEGPPGTLEGWFPTRRAAEDWMSDRLVAYGRAKAGLPPLPDASVDARVCQVASS